MLQKNIKSIVIGAALGTFIGSISALVIPQRQKILKTLKNQKKNWIEKAKDISENVLGEIPYPIEQKKETQAPTFFKGALVGLLVGAGSTFLFTPKTGKQLRNAIAKKYSDVSEKTQDLMEFFENHQPVTKKRTQIHAQSHTHHLKSPKIKSKAKHH